MIIRSSKTFAYVPQGKSGVISAVYGQNVTIAVFTGLSDELEELVYDEGIVCVEGNLPNVTCVYGGRGRKEVMLNCSVIVNSSRKYRFTVTGIIHIYTQAINLSSIAATKQYFFPTRTRIYIFISCCCGDLQWAIIVAVALTFCSFFVLSKMEVKKEHTVCPAAERM